MAPAAARDATPRKAPPRVLVVEDNRDVRAALRAFLKMFGVRIVDATLRDAVDRARSSRPRLVILDVGFPSDRGLETCRALHAAGLAPDLILTATWVGPREVETCREVGAVAVLEKPFRLREVWALIRHVLELPPSSRELAAGKRPGATTPRAGDG
jgi:DNA-binding response OmpR family regulator